MKQCLQNFKDKSAFHTTCCRTSTDRLSYQTNEHIPPLSFTRLQSCGHVTGDAGPRLLTYHYSGQANIRIRF